MNKEEINSELEGFKLVKHKINWEGFEYCFRFYSDFQNDVNDEKFHELRKGYLTNKNSSSELRNYIDKKIIELEDKRIN